MADGHSDKGSYSNSSLKISKQRWEAIFGKPEDAKVKTTMRRDFEGDFTNGGLMGKNRTEY